MPEVQVKAHPVQPGRYVLATKRAGKALWQQEFVVDTGRQLAATVPGDALVPLTLELSCVPAS